MTRRSKVSWGIPLLAAVASHIAAAAIPLSASIHAPSIVEEQSGRISLSSSVIAQPEPAAPDPSPQPAEEPEPPAEPRPSQPPAESPSEPVEPVIEREARADADAPRIAPVEPIEAKPKVHAPEEVPQQADAPDALAEPAVEPAAAAQQKPDPAGAAETSEEPPVSAAGNTELAGPHTTTASEPPVADIADTEVTGPPTTTATEPTVMDSPRSSEKSEGQRPNMDAYRRLLGEAIRSEQRYPAAARRLHLEGKVEVRVRLRPDGSLDGSPRVHASSGARSLDREAVRMVTAAAPFPPLPEGLPHERADIPIPIVFELR